MPNDILTSAQLAERWNVKTQWLRQMRHRGDGPPYFKANAGNHGKALYRLADIKAWEKRNQPGRKA